MLILFLYTDVRILSLFDHVDSNNKLLTYLLTSMVNTSRYDGRNGQYDGQYGRYDGLYSHYDGRYDRYDGRYDSRFNGRYGPYDGSIWSIRSI